MMKVKTSSWHYKLYVAVRRPWPFFIKEISSWTDYTVQPPVKNVVKGHRWGFGKEDFIDPPRPKNLCRYFWGTIFGFGILILQWLLIIILIIPAAFIAGFVFSLEYLVTKYRMKFPRKMKTFYVQNEEKEPGLFSSYLSARKQKVCPLITVIDDEK